MALPTANWSDWLNSTSRDPATRRRSKRQPAEAEGQPGQGRDLQAHVLCQDTQVVVGGIGLQGGQTQARLGFKIGGDERIGHQFRRDEPMEPQEPLPVAIQDSPAQHQPTTSSFPLNSPGRLGTLGCRHRVAPSWRLFWACPLGGWFIGREDSSETRILSWPEGASGQRAASLRALHVVPLTFDGEGLPCDVEGPGSGGGPFCLDAGPLSLGAIGQRCDFGAQSCGVAPQSLEVAARGSGVGASR
jgi:hypothetical protein